jgi:hypothetical protein
LYNSNNPTFLTLPVSPHLFNNNSAVSNDDTVIYPYATNEAGIADIYPTFRTAEGKNRIPDANPVPHKSDEEASIDDWEGRAIIEVVLEEA